MTAIVELKNATIVVNNGLNEEKVILDNVSLEIHEHDFYHHSWGQWCW